MQAPIISQRDWPPIGPAANFPKPSSPASSMYATNSVINNRGLIMAEMTKNPSKSQIEKFRETARELEADNDEARFDEKLQPEIAA
jgi:hypothetical protein